MSVCCPLHKITLRLPHCPDQFFLADDAFQGLDAYSPLRYSISQIMSCLLVGSDSPRRLSLPELSFEILPAQFAVSRHGKSISDVHTSIWHQRIAAKIRMTACRQMITRCVQDLLAVYEHYGL